MAQKQRSKECQRERQGWEKRKGKKNNSISQGTIKMQELQREQLRLSGRLTNQQPSQGLWWKLMTYSEYGIAGLKDPRSLKNNWIGNRYASKKFLLKRRKINNENKEWHLRKECFHGLPWLLLLIISCQLD